MDLKIGTDITRESNKIADKKALPSEKSNNGKDSSVNHLNPNQILAAQSAIKASAPFVRQVLPPAPDRYEKGRK